MRLPRMLRRRAARWDALDNPEPGTMHGGEPVPGHPADCPGCRAFWVALSDGWRRAD